MVFCFVKKKISGQHKSQNIYFFCRTKRNFFFQILTLGYMTKTLNQIIFVFLHQNQNIFFSNIGNQNIFLEKNHNPPLQVKWSFPYTVHLGTLTILLLPLPVGPLSRSRLYQHCLGSKIGLFAFRISSMSLKFPQCRRLFHYIMVRTSYIRYYGNHHQTNKHRTALKRFITLCFVKVEIRIENKQELFYNKDRTMDVRKIGRY